MVGANQLDVLKARLSAEYGVAIGFEPSTYNLARWISGPDRVVLQKFIEENRSAICDDVDGDPVFLASSAFMMRRARRNCPLPKLSRSATSRTSTSKRSPPEQGFLHSLNRYRASEAPTLFMAKQSNVRAKTPTWTSA